MQAVIQSTRVRIAALAATAMMAIGLAAAPAASAQQTGLVNVDVHNVLNNNDVSVQIPVSAAVNICNVDVAAINALIASHGSCDARSGNQTLTFTG
jgi:hypothetical protein